MNENVTMFFLRPNLICLSTVIFLTNLWKLTFVFLMSSLPLMLFENSSVLHKTKNTAILLSSY